MKLRSGALVVLSWLWAQPQTLVGGLGHLVFRRRRRQKNDWVTAIFVPGNWGALSLGPTVFLGEVADEAWTQRVLAHETGHSWQSLVLGPFYLLVIGLPSLVWAWWYTRWGQKRQVAYGSFYTEAWADRWGSFHE
jgi:hypothetical protein